jgi:hypothetical protein
MSKNRGAIEGRKSLRLGKEMPINVIYWMTKIAKLLQIWAGRLNMTMAGIKVWIKVCTIQSAQKINGT